MNNPDLKDIYNSDPAINAGEQAGSKAPETNIPAEENSPNGDNKPGEQTIDFTHPGINDPLSAKQIPGIDNTNPKAVADYLAAKNKSTEGKPSEEGKPTGDVSNENKPGEFTLPENFINEFNKKANTTFKSIDEVYSELANVQALRESEQALKETVASHVDPFGEDEELAKIYNFRKETGKTIEDYNLINGKNLDEMDSIEALTIQTVLSNPEYKGKEDLVRDSLKQKFNLDDDSIDGREKEILQMNVDIAGKKAKQELKDLQSKIVAPDGTKTAQLTEQQKQQIEDDNKLWADTIPGIAESFSKFPVYSSTKDMQEGKESLTNIEIPADVRSEYGKILAEYVKANNIQPTKKNVQMLNDMMHRDYISNNYLSIANAYANKKVEDNNAMWSERTGQSTNKMREQFVSGNAKKTSVESFNQSEVDRVMGMIPGR